MQCNKNYKLKSDSRLFKRRPNTALHRDFIALYKRLSTFVLFSA